MTTENIQKYIALPASLSSGLNKPRLIQTVQILNIIPNKQSGT